MKVVVGSKNPVKINAVRVAFETVFPDKKWEVEGVAVSSGVSSQPMSDLEAIKGARNRAKKALKAVKADYGVGLEGGMQKVGKDWLESGVMVVIDKKGNIGIGSSIRMLMPKKLLQLIEKGVELGTACDMVFKKTNSKQQEGFFGIMTAGYIDRTHGYVDGVIAALTRFLKPEVFK